MKRRSNETKLIMETWRRFINEDASMPDQPYDPNQPYDPDQPPYESDEPVDPDPDLHPELVHDDMPGDDMRMPSEYDDGY